MVLGKTATHMQRNKTGLLTHTMHTKKKSRLMKNFNVKSGTIKLTEENISSKLFGICLSNIL